MANFYYTQAEWLNTSLSDQQAYLSQQATIEMISCHYWQCDDSWRIDNRQLADDFFFIPVVGGIECVINNHAVSIQPGHCALMPFGLIHNGRMPEGQTHLEIIAIHAHVRNQAGMRLLPGVNQYHLALPSPENDITLIKQLSVLSAQDDQAFDDIGKWWLRQLLITNLANGLTIEAPESQIDARILSCLDTIHTHYAQDIDVESLAQQSQISTVQLRKLFNRDVGQTPKAYIATYRLRMAANLLCSSNRTVRTISQDCGFQDEHYFHLCFKKHYGATPGQYRRARRSEV